MGGKRDEYIYNGKHVKRKAKCVCVREGERGCQQYYTQCKYIIPLLQQQKREKREREEKNVSRVVL